MRWEAKMSDRIASLESVLIHLKGLSFKVYLCIRTCVYEVGGTSYI